MSGTSHEHHHGHGLIIGVIAALLGVAAGAGVAVLVLGGAQPVGMEGDDAAAQGGMPPAMVNVAAVSQQELAERFDVVGRLQEMRSAIVAAEVAGRVLNAPIEPGDAVVGGETVLAEIDGVWARLALRQAEAQVAAARATFDQSQRDYEYLRKLSEGGSAKPKEVEDARAQVEAGQAALDAAVAMRDEAQQRVERLAIVAPFDGTVVQRLVERGQWVSPGAAVAMVITTGQLDAEVYVPEQHIGKVAVGEQVQVSIDPLKESDEGEIVAVVPLASNAARTFPVKIRLDDRGGKLKAGMSVTAHLPIAEKQMRLVVPRDAVLFSGADARVWTVGPPAGQDQPPSAAPVAVNVLFGTADDYVIEPLGHGELMPGALVVVQGGEKLIPGQGLLFQPLPPPEVK
ncbi:MAG: efflux RND transporter periplasmic adaptor subunit [Phycisphaeraceae bacterium]|nr:efflux RND transporter periplasmic adaptor subunit [Phycisphaeraceae bacterium]